MTQRERVQMKWIYISLSLKQCAKSSYRSLSGYLIVVLVTGEGGYTPTHPVSHLTWCRGMEDAVCRWWISAKANGHSALIHGVQWRKSLCSLHWKDLFCYLVCVGGGGVLGKRHTGILKCCNLGEKAVKTEGPAFLLVTDSGAPRVEYAARCWVNPPGWYPEGLPSPKSHAKIALCEGDGVLLLHLLDPPTLKPQLHICETCGRAEQLLLTVLTYTGHQVPVLRELPALTPSEILGSSGPARESCWAPSSSKAGTVLVSHQCPMDRQDDWIGRWSTPLTINRKRRNKKGEHFVV